MPKRKREKISIKDWIALLAGLLAVIGWALWITNIVLDRVEKAREAEINQPPVIQNLQLDRDKAAVGETIDAKVIVKDPNLPEDEIDYFWQAHLGRIGTQLNRFQGPEVTYVAPDQPGVDFIEIIVNDREGETDRDFRAITITERRKKQVIVGNKNFTEQYIVGELMKQLLEDRGFAVKLVSDLYSPDLGEGWKTATLMFAPIIPGRLGWFL